jgi:hypothetical protein
MDTQPAPVMTAPSASRCPIDHTAMAKQAAAPAESADAAAAVAGGCPVMHGGVRRSPADHIARKVLRIKERPAGITDAAAYGAFQRSMLISATRCLLTYIVFPFVLPAVGVATGVGPILGILIGSIAIVCDVFAVRRFHAVDHRWRWYFTAIAACVIALLGVLLVQDFAELLG